MGILPEEALIDGFAGATFGLECAGIVRASGRRRGAGGRRPRCRVRARLIGNAGDDRSQGGDLDPVETSFAAAATAPVAFVTVIYALGHLGRLMRTRPC